MEKYVNKATILKAIEDEKKHSMTQSDSPFGSPRVPDVPQHVPTLDVPASTAHILGTSESFANCL